MRQPFILPEEWIGKISRLSVVTTSKFLGAHKGSHRSKRFGYSLDFSDFREYYPGDDVRQVDWNVYARTEKYYIKRYLDEQEMRVHILLDTSRSMGDEKKWLFARQIAACLGLIVLNHDDRLAFSYLQNDKTGMFRQKGATFRKAFLQTVTNIKEADFQGKFAENAIKQMSKDSTVLFIISDGYEPIEEWEQLFKRLPRFAKDIRFIQIVTKEELEPTFTGDVRLIDAETNEDVSVSVTSRVLDNYEKTRKQHELELEAIASRYGIRKIQLVVDDGLEYALFHKLVKEHWVQ